MVVDPQTCDAPVLLTQTHDGSAFDSGEVVLDDWLRQRAWQDLQSAASRTYVVCPAESLKIVGYFALSMGQIPAIILGRLAIDRTWQGRGLGRALLANGVRRALLASREVSARLIVVHAISTAAEAFTLRHGFARLPVEAPTLALDLVKLQRLGDGA